MSLLCDWLYKVPVCGEGQVEHDINRSVIATFKLNSFVAKQIAEGVTQCDESYRFG